MTANSPSQRSEPRAYARDAEWALLDVNEYTYIEPSFLAEYNYLVHTRNNLVAQIRARRVKAKEATDAKYERLVLAAVPIVLVFSFIPFPFQNIFDLLLRIPLCFFASAVLIAVYNAVFCMDEKILEKLSRPGTRYFTGDKERDLVIAETKLGAMRSVFESKIANKREYWLSLSPQMFEVQVAALFNRCGFHATVTKGSGDGGIDIVMTKDFRQTIVQCKLHKKPVGPHVVRDLYGALQDSQADEAILVATAGFTSGCVQFAEGKPITLMALDDLLTLAVNSERSKSTRQ